MGLLDRLIGGSDADPNRGPRASEYVEGSDYHADRYTREDLSDELDLFFLDRWPTGKTVEEFEMIYVDDPALEDPILLRSASDIFIPEGTEIFPFDRSMGVEIEDIIYWTTYGQLVTPELASVVDRDWRFDIPDTMEGRDIVNRKMTVEEYEFIEVVLSTLSASDRPETPE